jgi:hypothetical protein
LLAAVTGGCKSKRASHDAGADAVLADGTPAEGAQFEAIDGGAAARAEGEGKVAESAVMAALASPTPIFSRPEFPPKDPSRASDEKSGVIRLGSLRKGATVNVKPNLLKRSNCVEGWFQLVAGGWVCGKYATADLSHKELASAPHPPFADEPLPYEYGLNLTNGTPLYRRAPLRRERAVHEKGLALGRAWSPEHRERAAKEAREERGDTPWYLRDHGGQKPVVSFDDLKGESGLVELRMVRGFYLALDKKVSAFAGKFWRTTRGQFVPADHVLVHKPKTEFEGVWVGRDEEPRKLPLAFVTGPKAWKWRIDEGRAKRTEHVDRFTIVSLTGKKEIVEQRAYWETSEGWYFRTMDGTIARSMPRPSDVPAGERWIDVNTTNQTLVAYEGDKPVFATIVSTGRRGSGPDGGSDEKTKDYRTPTGSFRIREKHISTTMDDDSASDGPYSIQDVPWVMYFNKGVALHGAFWHSRFGFERSHGCVNMTPHDARQIFTWAGPNLPDGWHAVRATSANQGTRIVVHE